MSTMLQRFEQSPVRSLNNSNTAQSFYITDCMSDMCSLLSPKLSYGKTFWKICSFTVLARVKIGRFTPSQVEKQHIVTSWGGF